MMKRSLAGVGLLFLSVGSAVSEHLFSDPGARHREISPVEMQMASVAVDKVYGLLLAAPKSGCRRVRYRVETAGGMLLGKTPALAPGKAAVVRIGNGFSPGAHRLIVIAEGCSKAPVLPRRVTLHKASPDHGWRASLALAP